MIPERAYDDLDDGGDGEGMILGVFFKRSQQGC